METKGDTTEETLRIVLEEVDVLRLVVMDLRNTIIQQDQRITGLVTSQIQDHDKIRKLERDYRTLRKNSIFCDNQSKESVEDLQTNETKLAGVFEHISPMVSTVEETSKNGNKAPKTRQIGQEIVAFYAYMSSDLLPGIHHTIPFDVVKTNDGNGYHHNTGIFVAPESGVYVFTWTIRMTLDSQHSTELVVNNVVWGATFMRTHTPEDQTMSGTVVVHVNRNDDVYVRTHVSYPYNSGNIRSDQYSRSSFAGWKLN